MKHYDYEISLFIDGELPDEEQNKLFEHLAECTKCRSTLMEFMDIKDKSEKYFAEQLPESDGTVIPLFNQTQKNKRNYYREAFYFAAAACLLLGFLFLLNKTEETELKNKLNKLNAEYSSLQKNYRSESEKTLEKVTTAENSFPENKTFAMKKADSKQGNEEYSNIGMEKPVEESMINKEMAGVTIRKALDNYLQSSFASDNITGEVINKKNEKSEALRLQYKNVQVKNKYETRDLLQRRNPYLSEGKIKTDTAKIRDLLLRYDEDKIEFRQLVENNIGHTKPGTVEPASSYEQYLKSLKTERVTKNDFMTPQVIGN